MIPPSNRSCFSVLLVAALLQAIPLSFCVAAESSGDRLVRVSGLAARRQAIEAGGRLLTDYGAFQIYQFPSGVGKGLSPGPDLEYQDHLRFIELTGHRINTLATATSRVKARPGKTVPHRLHLVQFVGPVRPDWRSLLLQGGVKIVSYVPQNAFLVYGSEEAIGRLQQTLAGVAQVRWQGRYDSKFKIHPRAGVEPKALFMIQLMADPKANDQTIAAIRQNSAGLTKVQGRVMQYINVAAELPTAALTGLAERPDVISILPLGRPSKGDERQAQLVAGNILSNAPSGPGYLAWLASKGFTQSQFDASGFVVNVADSGIDNGTTSPGHFGLYPLGNTNLAGRIAYNRIVGTPSLGILAGCDGHGTINAHILGGYGSGGGFPLVDSAGYSYGLGVAPFARLGSSVIFDPDDFTYPSLTELEALAFHDNARIDSNSWGYQLGYGAYDAVTQEYDALVRDSQPDGSAHPTPGNQEMVIVFAAGNFGPTASTVAVPASGKNTLSVGATEGVRSMNFANGGNNAAGNDGNYFPDTVADNANEMAAFSGRGPSTDGRFKPDLVAPGTHITGGVPVDSITNGFSASPCFNARGIAALPCTNFLNLGFILVCNTNVTNPRSNYFFFPVGQQLYSVSSGTSHSTPAVSGAAALLRQYFINRGSNPPSPAMTRAWLMNSASYLSTPGSEPSLPSNAQGMGRLNLGNAFDGLPRLERDQLASDKFTASGQQRSFTVSVAATNKPVRITMVWTDAPGATFGHAYNNDLDLIVDCAGRRYRGNSFSGEYSVPSSAADVRNNVESVYLPAGTTGPLTVTVVAANINSDGVPNDAAPFDQDFALVGANLDSAAVPVMTSGGAALAVESCVPANGVPDLNEYITLNLSLLNVGSAATTNLTATLQPGTGVYFPSGPKSYGALAPGGASVTQPFSLTVTGQCGGILTATWTLMDGATPMGTVTHGFRIGTFGLSTNVFVQGATISVSTSNSAPAFPYPSSLTVSGVTGLVQKVTATLSNLSHTWQSDMDVLLSAPGGKSVLLMSHAGANIPTENATVTFDDDAANYLPRWDPATNGVFRPTLYRNDLMPAPAPPQPIPPSAYSDYLTNFIGEVAAGTWSLWVYDRFDADGGAIQNGWTLRIVTGNPGCCDRSLADDDKDGMTTAEEVRAGTNPADPDSRLKITKVAETLTAMEISFPTVIGRTYQLERNDTFPLGIWEVVQSNVAGTGATVTVADPGVLPWPTRLYRVRLTAP